MSKPIIALVENEDDIKNDFQATFDDQFEVIPCDIKTSLDEMIEYLLEMKVDAYVLDYLLNDNNPNIHYKGTDLYEAISDAKYKIPMIILTGHEEDIADAIDDPYFIISKDYMNKPDIFARKLNKVILEYKESIEYSVSKIKEITAKKASNEALTLKDEEELIKCDRYLERVHCDYNVIPDSFKASSVGSKLDRLLEITEKLIDIKKDEVPSKEKS